MLLFIAMLIPSLSWGEENSDQNITSGRWTTKYKYSQGILLLHWTHVYEGLDTVFRLDFPPLKGKTSSLKVEGQPNFNEAKSIVAFTDCADDGCSSEIRLVDLVNRKELPKIRLNDQGQFYLSSEWKGKILTVKVEFPESNSEKKIIVHKFTISSTGALEWGEEDRNFIK